MVKTHEINLNSSEFENFRDVDYIILKTENININDYILFREIKDNIDTGLFSMTQVLNIINNEGLKDEYNLVILRKIN